MNEFAKPVSNGWITPHWSVNEIKRIRRRLREDSINYRLPCAFEIVLPEKDPTKVKAAAALEGFGIFGTYITRSRLTPRVKRSIRLHSLLAAAREFKDIRDLHIDYIARTPDDRCSVRDCEIVMEANKHLFLEVIEGFWLAIGLGGNAPVSASIQRQPSGRKKRSAGDSAVNNGRDTVSQCLKDELGKRGPSRISELIRNASEFLPKNRSANSVAPTLITRKDLFCRPLPGLYALHDQVPSPAQLISERPDYLYHEYQIRLYALARRAGERWGAFELWRPETEYLWCIWARKYADSELLESLLSVAQPTKWPHSEDKNEWKEFAKARGRFSIQFPLILDGLVRPDLKRLFAACAYVRNHGHLNWISGNRILMRRVSEYASGALLATLIALDVLSPDATDWQANHSAGSALVEKFNQLDAEHHRGKCLDWRSSLGRKLEAEAVAGSFNRGWVSRDWIGSIFGCDSMPNLHRATQLTPLDKLLSESAKLKKSAMQKEILGGLIHPNEEDN